MFRRVKLPGWVLVSFGILVDFLVWRDIVQFVSEQVQRLGDWVSIVTLALGSPIFGNILILVGVLYLLFVGEPKSQARSRFWNFAAWCLVAICGFFVFALSEAAYVAVNISPIRNLTAFQHEIIKKEAINMAPYLATGHGVIPLTVMSVDTPEADSYTSQIMDAFRDGGVASQSLAQGVSAPFPMKVLSLKVRGVFIQVGSPSTPPDGAKARWKILSDAGLKPRYFDSPAQGPAGYVLTVGLP